MKAIKRRAFIREGDRPAWRRQLTEAGQPVDDLLAANLMAYAEWINEQAGPGRRQTACRFSLPTYQGCN